ncbi:MAG: penicillin-binding protein [Chloroflexota bacterium]|nr:penicillin-binding protein [Chloroflexota bacterium]MDE3192512.1 penicillin-binding protein [Chloroflexota bacterium]
MAKGRGIMPGRYRAYRFPHHDGRLSRRPSVGVSRVGTLAGALGIFVALFALFAGTAAASAISFFTSDLPAIDDLSTAPMPLSTLIYDRSGQHLLYRLEDQRRELVGLDQVPKLMQDATVSIEDKTFWSNPGIDVGGIVRAAQTDLTSHGIQEGGSTITQQLIKQRLVGDAPTFTRKIKEAILALQAGRIYSKQQILEMYLNQVYYGNQSYGVKAAALTYFGVTDLSKLTLGQMALLAGLPQAPSKYDPVRDLATAQARRTEVLDSMVDNGYVTAAQAAAAKQEPIKVQPVATPIAAPWFVYKVRDQLVSLYGERGTYEGGYTVYSSLDWNMQDLATQELQSHVKGLNYTNMHNGALITMDPTTGEILAYVGSVDYGDHSPQVQGDYDSAGIAYRQPGSTFKIFTYLAGMQDAHLTAASMLDDIDFCMPDGSGSKWCPKDAPQIGGWSPQNGPVSMRQALRESLNLPAINVGRMVGVPKIMDMVSQLGIRRDWGDPSRYGLSFAIGAGELRLLDMVSAYQVVADLGTRVEPTFISKIVDPHGKVVKDYTKPEGKQVLDPGIAYVFDSILKDNTDPNGSWIFGPWTSIGRPAGLKTGTTDNLQDVWAIGFTPQRLTGIWMGNADNSQMYGISSALGPGVLWRDYMSKVVGGLPPVWYQAPPNVVHVTVCENPALRGGNGSGLLPGPGCPASWRKDEVFVKGTEPTTDDRAVMINGCYRVISPFTDWQGYVNAWVAGHSSLSGGRMGYCYVAGAFATIPPGFGPSPTPKPSASPGGSPSPFPLPSPAAPRHRHP